KDYKLEIHYHPGKANVVADALSRKAQCHCTTIQSNLKTLCEEMGELSLEIVKQGTLQNIMIQDTLKERIITAQKEDPWVKALYQQKAEGKIPELNQEEDGGLYFKNRIVVPEDESLRKLILEEAHSSKFSIHPGTNKMYQDLKQRFWWAKMKPEIARYVSECDTCQRVKPILQKSAGLLQPSEIPVWKWEDISMDFIVGLPTTSKGYDSIWVIVDRLTKSAHFIPVKTTYPVSTYAKLYIARIVSLHGVPKTIISDRGSQFVSRFWEQLQKDMGTTLIRSSAYHPQTGGQTERVNQILEDMLRACVLTFSKLWDECLPLAEFSYNNSYQASIKMAPFEALYGRRCRTPLNWSGVGERTHLGSDLVMETEEKVRKIRKHLEIAQSRQKSYSDKRRRSLEFSAGDFVYLKVSPMKGVQRFGIKGKLAPRYIGPYEILEQKGPVAYKLSLPDQLASIHDVFHVSQLKKCLRVPEEILEDPDIELEPDLTYEEKPIKILDQKTRDTRTRSITFYKVQWKNHTPDEATWEKAEDLESKYPELFETVRNR
ncbi:hypothetical protein NP303_24795, partial [Salmonella enterica]|nr:hypothetical protein [Salmonella enterica]